MAACVALAWLPDADVFWVWLGAPDRGVLGHRGFTHTPLFALGVGLLVAGYWWRSRRAKPVSVGLLAVALVCSHSVLDALAQDGRGMLFLWPFSMERFHLPWRPIPDAPVGLALLTRTGLRHLAVEFVLFLPFTVLALWRTPRTAPAPARAVAHRRFATPASVRQLLRDWAT